jgi:hypothetical protein
MSKPTRVGIYQVDEAGATGKRVGEGSLISPDWVVAHCRLSDPLSQIAQGGGSQRLRLGIAAADPDASVEVIDAARIEFRKFEGTGEGLVGLVLQNRSEDLVSYEVVPGLSDEQYFTEEDLQLVLKYLLTPPAEVVIDTSLYFPDGRWKIAGFGGS